MLSLVVAGAAAPTRTTEVGDFPGGPQPGQLGPAVVAGHVGSRTGPAVFSRLRDLHPGHGAAEAGR